MKKCKVDAAVHADDIPEPTTKSTESRWLPRTRARERKYRKKDDKTWAVQFFYEEHRSQSTEHGAPETSDACQRFGSGRFPVIELNCQMRNPPAPQSGLAPRHSTGPPSPTQPLFLASTALTGHCPATVTLPLVTCPAANRTP